MTACSTKISINDRITDFATHGESHTVECCHELPALLALMGIEIITDVGFVVKAFTQEMRAPGPTTVSEHDSGTEDSWTDVNEGKT